MHCTVILRYFHTYLKTTQLFCSLPHGMHGHSAGQCCFRHPHDEVLLGLDQSCAAQHLASSDADMPREGAGMAPLESAVPANQVEHYLEAHDAVEVVHFCQVLSSNTDLFLDEHRPTRSGGRLALLGDNYHGSEVRCYCCILLQDASHKLP